jgi:hypothetical protein
MDHPEEKQRRTIHNEVLPPSFPATVAIRVQPVNSPGHIDFNHPR